MTDRILTDQELLKYHGSLVDFDFDTADDLRALLASHRALAARLEGVQAALERALWLFSKESGWGTWPRMEGAALYDDVLAFEKAARAALAKKPEIK